MSKFLSRFSLGTVLGFFTLLICVAVVGLSAKLMVASYSSWQTARSVTALTNQDVFVFNVLQALRYERVDTDTVLRMPADKAAALVKGVANFRADNNETPVVLMGYANPIEAMGVETFAAAAFDAGVDGVLVVDYPPEESADFAARLRAHGMDLIFLLAPTSTEQRMQQVAAVASGYVYYVSLKGVTGSGALNTAEVEAMLPRIRQHVHIPVGVGFGIRDAETARAIGKVADAVVIGSRLIQVIEVQPHERVVAAAMDFLRPVRAALDA